MEMSRYAIRIKFLNVEVQMSWGVALILIGVTGDLILLAGSVWK